MYIRPLVYVHHLYVTVTMSYVQRKKSTVIIHICFTLGEGYSKIQYSSVQKDHATFIKMEEALVSVITKYFSPLLTNAYLS